MRHLTFTSFLYVFLTLFVAAPAYCDDEFDWGDFDSILKRHVKAGSFQGINANLLDYTSLLNNQQFDTIGKQLENYNPSNLLGNEKLAFYINAYNYYAIKIVVDNWPVNGIKDIGNLLRPVWKKTVGKLNNQAITLDEIEHEILRPLGEPRVHFAIVCSSMSCPDIRDEVYTADKLNQQLDDQTEQFLNNKTKGAAIKNGELYLSKIFDWFEEDFEIKGGVYEFITSYKSDLSAYKEFETLDYNWKLNLLRN